MDTDPAKWCRSEGIRVHNTGLKYYKMILKSKKYLIFYNMWHSVPQNPDPNFLGMLDPRSITLLTTIVSWGELVRYHKISEKGSNALKEVKTRGKKIRLAQPLWEVRTAKICLHGSSEGFALKQRLEKRLSVHFMVTGKFL